MRDMGFQKEVLPPRWVDPCEGSISHRVVGAICFVVGVVGGLALFTGAWP